MRKTAFLVHYWRKEGRKAVKESTWRNWSIWLSWKQELIATTAFTGRVECCLRWEEIDCTSYGMIKKLESKWCKCEWQRIFIISSEVSKIQGKKLPGTGGTPEKTRGISCYGTGRFSEGDVAFETGHSDYSNLAWHLFKARWATAHNWEEEAHIWFLCTASKCVRGCFFCRISMLYAAFRFNLHLSITNWCGHQMVPLGR